MWDPPVKTNTIDFTAFWTNIIDLWRRKVNQFQLRRKTRLISMLSKPIEDILLLLWILFCCCCCLSQKSTFKVCFFLLFFSFFFLLLILLTNLECLVKMGFVTSVIFLTFCFCGYRWLTQLKLCLNHGWNVLVFIIKPITHRIQTTITHGFLHFFSNLKWL